MLKDVQARLDKREAGEKTEDRPDPEQSDNRQYILDGRRPTASMNDRDRTFWDRVLVRERVLRITP